MNPDDDHEPRRRHVAVMAMASRPPADRSGSKRRFRFLPFLALVLTFFLPAPSLRAEIQFDVFLGFDDRIREGHWFPVAFEILNDGPTFTGTVSIAPEGNLPSHRRSFTLELPTGTRKNVVIPVFSSAGRYSRWEARLDDPSGKLMAERANIAPRDTASPIPLLGALPRTFGGLPTFPEVKNRGPEFQPAVARLQPNLLPANPLAYESLTACYLSSEKAADLKADQADALLAWIHQGGHLIVAIEQPSDVTGLPWLRDILPFAPESVVSRHLEGSFERWLVSGRRILQLPSALRRPGSTPRSRSARRAGRVTVQTPASASPLDPVTTIEPQNDFNNAEFPIITGRPLDAQVILGLGDAPLILSAPRGRGTVTALAFSPEREPFRSWKNRPWFWAKLVGVPPELLTESESIRSGGLSIDGILGAMLDSRQVRKLPVAALLLLLVVYLAVIGPFDQWILKRTNRQMWTWVTFPLWVIVFSGLIYFIGYRLRAGDLEWNELQVVDQLPLPRGEGAALRGRTWASLYSPANARYRLASDQPFATLRPEFQGGGAGRADSGRLILRHPARGIDADAYVPVWVSQLFASDWLDTGPSLLSGSLIRSPAGPTLTLLVTNRSRFSFSEIRVAYGARLHNLGPLAAGQQASLQLGTDTEAPGLDETMNRLRTTAGIVQQRRYAFGSEGAGQLTRDLQGVILASLVDRASSLATDQPGEGFSSPNTFDLSPLLDRGEAVLFAWAPGQSIATPLHRFAPIRHQRDSVLRVAFHPAGPPSRPPPNTVRTPTTAPATATAP